MRMLVLIVLIFLIVLMTASQHVLQPTRSNSILDLVLTREPHLVSNVEVMEHLGNSDHNMVTLSVHHVQEILDSTKLFHDYCKGD